MELEQIVTRIASLIPLIDDTTEIQNHNRRNKRPYLKGVATLFEPQFTKELVRCWKEYYPDELGHIHDEHPYYGSKETCDVVLTSNGFNTKLGSFEWAVEIKYLRLVGNNGNNNDYVLQKSISPFLKDRSLVHDIEKLKNATFSKRKAVIFYGFDYNENSVANAELISKKITESLGKSTRYVDLPENIDDFFHSDIAPIAKNLGRVIRSVNKHGNEYSLGPVTDVIDSYITKIGQIVDGPKTSKFSGLERHPCGEFGRVVGWEI